MLLATICRVETSHGSGKLACHPVAACSDALIVYLLQKLFNALAIESRHSASAAGSTVSAILERLFNRIKQMPGLATRYDRRADNYLAALKLAATRIWIASANESAS